MIELESIQKPEFPKRKTSFNTAKSQPLTHLQSKKESRQEEEIVVKQEEKPKKSLKRNKTTPNLRKGSGQIKGLKATETKAIKKSEVNDSFMLDRPPDQLTDISSEFERLPSPSSQRSFLPKPTSAPLNIEKANELNKMINHTNKKNQKEKDEHNELVLTKQKSYPLPKQDIFKNIEFNKSNSRSKNYNLMSMSSFNKNKKGFSELSVINPPSGFNVPGNRVDFPYYPNHFHSPYNTNEQNYFQSKVPLI